MKKFMECLNFRFFSRTGILLIFFLDVFVGLSQSRIDSLNDVLEEAIYDSLKVDTYWALCQELRRNGAIEEAEKALVQGLTLAETSGLPRRQMRLLIAYGRFFEDRNSPNFDSALLLFKKAHRVATTYLPIGYHALTLNYLGDFFKYSKREYIDSAIYYYGQTLGLYNTSREISKLDTDEKSYALNQIAHSYLSKGETEKALSYAERVVEIQPEEGYAYNMMSAIHHNMGNYSLAIEYALTMLEKVDENDHRTRADAYANLARSYTAQKEYIKALKYLKGFYGIDSTYNYEYSMITSANNLADGYSNLGEYQLAKHYFRKSIQIGTKRQINCPLYLPMLGLGKLFFSQNQFDSALYYYENAVKYCDLCNHVEKKASAVLNIGFIMLELGDKEAATKHFEEVLLLSDLTKSKVHLSKAHYGLYELRKESGAYEEALKNLEIAKAQNDSLFNKETTSRIAKLEAEFEFEQKKDSIQTANQLESLAFSREIEVQKNRHYAAIAGLLLLLIIAAILSRFYFVKKRDNDLLEKKNHEIQEMNQNLRELSNYKEGLTHMIAHDMKNRLNVVMGMSDGTPNTDRMKEINQAGKMILQMVTNMLDVQKFEESRMHLNLKPTALRDLIDQAAHQLELLFVSRSIRFENRVSGGIVVEVDEDLLIRVFDNLFSNAVKYSDIGGRLTVSFESDGERAKISVQDEGRGIHQEELPYVFDKFWQVDVKKADRVPSNGLGLTFCKLAIEAHGGGIEVASTSGKGSTFTFDVRLLEKGEPAKATQEKIQPPNMILRPAQRDILQPYIEKIRSYPPNKAGKIHTVLSEIESEDPAVAEWKRKVKRAVFEYDEKALDELLG